MIGQIHDWLCRISMIVKESPFGISRRSPERYSKSGGTSVSSEYRHTEPATFLRTIQHGIGGPPRGIHSLPICKPPSGVELVTNPTNLACTERSADTNQANIRMRSVTSRCSNRSVSLGGIMLELMLEECSRRKPSIGVAISASLISAGIIR